MWGGGKKGPTQPKGMGISPNPAVSVSTLSRHDNNNDRHHRCCCSSYYYCYSCCYCSFFSCCSRAGCRTCPWKRCWRLPCWRYGLLLLCGATLLSALIPGAPLARYLLSKDAERHRLLAENEHRLQRSRQILERYRSQSQDGRRVTRDGSAADVGVTVLTMARGRRMKGEVSYRTEYLTQSVATVLHVMNDTSLARSYTFHICNIDDDPDRFSEAKTLEDVVPVFKRYGGSGANSTGKPPSTTIWEKLKRDYVYCMRQTLAQGVSYVLLLEDDAVAHPDLFHVLEHVLAKVIEAPGARPVAYVKLYHPQRLLGYLSLEVERLTELVALSLTLGAVLTWWRAAAASQRSGGGGGGGGSWHHPHHPHHDLATLPYREVVWRWAGWTVVVAVLALAVGRTNLLELRRLSPHLYQVTPTPSCCIPAVLYTRQGAADFAGFLSNVTCTARHSTDIRMDEFREVRTRGRGLLVQPNLFSHIGLVSSLRSREVNPLMVQ